MSKLWSAAGAVGGLALLALAGAAVAQTANRTRSGKALAAAIPETSRSGFVGSGTCRGCHPSDYTSWYHSYHRTMTQPASPETVQAPFDGRELTDPTGTYRVERRGEEFWVYLRDPTWLLEHMDDEELPGDPPWAWKRVVMLTGSHHMQVFWVAGDGPRKLHAFPFSYLLETDDQPAQWVPNESTLLRPPIEDGVYTWNYVCIKCHAVAGAPRVTENVVDRGDGTRAQTAVAELGIACESCHGPGAVHVARQQHPATRYASHLQENADTTIVHPGKLDGERSSAVCGQCHAITRFADEDSWRGEGSTFLPGQTLEPAIRVVRHPVHATQPWLDHEVAEDPDFFVKRFWSDGMVRISGREYNGLIESPCFQADDFSCLSCHAMHTGKPTDQLRPDLDADTSCTQCHEPFANGISAHTHHAEDSSGSQCVNCHMPHTTYGLLKAIRSHEIDSPNLEEALQTGRPNACNLCHLDRTLAWTGGWLERWYGLSQPDLEPDEREVAAAILWMLRGDAGVRALVAWHVGWEAAAQTSQTQVLAPFLAELLIDEYAAVRHIAGRSLREIAGFKQIPYDPVGTAEQRAQARAAVFTQWGNLPRESCAPQLLQDEMCRLRQASFEELLGQRPSYPVILEE